MKKLTVRARLTLATFLCIFVPVRAQSGAEIAPVLHLLLSPNSDTPPIEEPITQNNDLGIETNLGPRSSSLTEEALSDAAHPLTSKIATLSSRDELYGAGVVYRPGYTHRSFLLNDAASSATEMMVPSSDDGWTRTTNSYMDNLDYYPYEHKAAVAADIDGDGRQEMITAFSVIRREGTQYLVDDVNLHIMYDSEEGFREEILAPLTALNTDNFGNASYTNCDYYPGTCLDLEAGDLDGDGIDELVLVINYQRSFYILDGITLDLVAYDSAPVVADPGGILLADVADFDSDGQAEIALAFSDGSPTDTFRFPGAYFLYEYMNESLNLFRSGWLENTETELDSYINVCAADIDGDNIPEIVFGGRNQDEDYTRLMVLEDGRGLVSGELSTPYTLHETVPLHEITRPNPSRPDLEYWNGILECGDFDSDGVDEVFFYDSIVGFDDESTTWVPVYGDMRDTQVTGRAVASTQLVTVGDFDEYDDSGREDLAIITIYPRVFSIFGADLQSNGVIGLRKQFNLDFQSGLENGVLVAGNVDSDSRIVEYTGEHTEIFSSPEVMAVLVSAPFNGDLAHADGYTVLGKSISSGGSINQAIGGSVGISVGTSIDTDIPFVPDFELEIKTTVTVAGDFIWGQGDEYTFTSSVENPSGQDLVIANVIPYDAYAYLIKDSPIPEEIGEIFTLNIPRRPQTYTFERNDYNARNGEWADVDERVLSHQVGVPSTYPTPAKRDELMANSIFALRSPNTRICGMGGSVQILTCEWQQSYSEASSADVSVETEIESNIAGVLLGMNAGLHYGVEIEWHWSTSTFIEGAVGDMLPSTGDTDRTFAWGVFAYEDILPDNKNPFMVVNYWHQVLH